VIVISALIGIIILIIVLGIVWWAIQQLLPIIPMGEPFRTILRVLFVVLAAFVGLWIIIMLIKSAGVHVPNLGGMIQ
jgi:hypothetical protein